MTSSGQLARFMDGKQEADSDCAFGQFETTQVLLFKEKTIQDYLGRICQQLPVPNGKNERC